MSQENVEIIRVLYDSFGKGDIPTVLGQMDQNIEWREAENFIYADRNPYLGPQAVLEGVFMRLGTEWEGFTVTPEEWLDAGNHVVVLGSYSGTNKATGREVRAQFAHVWGVRGERVVRFQQYTDTKQFAEAITD
ncbi:MAG TPA: nuclear transport factor 2 family protein [Pyrinomonadaceae bacterium]|nr:nuclear transport factor 2 family protein [Pyrinomonadaceae bacterium]